MLSLFLAGNTGRDAEYRTTQNGAEMCRFTVAAETGFGDSKRTTWVDVTKWGKGSEGLAKMLRKGSKVAVSGELSLREHEGKTYVQCRADNVKVLSTPDGPRSGAGRAQEPHPGAHGGDYPDHDDGSDIPF